MEEISSNTLNPTDLDIDENTNAKYNSYNTLNITKVRAYFPILHLVISFPKMVIKDTDLILIVVLVVVLKHMLDGVGSGTTRMINVPVQM